MFKSLLHTKQKKMKKEMQNKKWPPQQTALQLRHIDKIFIHSTASKISTQNNIVVPQTTWPQWYRSTPL